MAKFQKKPDTVFAGPAVVEAITFDELVEYGLNHSKNIVEGMPWSFDYKGQPITHENNNCYLVPCDGQILKFERGDLLADLEGDLLPFRKPVFLAIYKPIQG